jgi:hypothetical protein
MQKRHRAFFLTIFLHISFIAFAFPASAISRPIAFPVKDPYSFRDDYLDPRGGGTRKHLGIDIIAEKMTPVFSAVDGNITYVVSPEASWGYAIEIRDSDGYAYNYLHLNNDTPGTDDGKGGGVKEIVKPGESSTIDDVDCIRAKGKTVCGGKSESGCNEMCGGKDWYKIRGDIYIEDDPNDSDNAVVKAYWYNWCRSGACKLNPVKAAIGGTVGAIGGALGGAKIGGLIGTIGGPAGAVGGAIIGAGVGIFISWVF